VKLDVAVELALGGEANPGLTFDQARRGLATMYRVPASSIDFIVRG
jgi:hypothetical protein